MALKVATTATTSLHWPHPLVPQSPASVVSVAATNQSSKRRGFVAGEGVVRGGGGLFCRSKLYRSGSCDIPKPRGRIVTRAMSASLASFSDDEFSKQIQELALRFQLSDEAQTSMEDEKVENRKPFEREFTVRDEIIPANMERIANSVEFPVSLRMIKRKMQWQEGFREVGESAYCSVKKAFSSMVFIIQELHSYTLQMREVLYYEDLQGILARVQDEMNASFVWLFQQVFSHTPTLMVYVMILLANYSVHSMASNPAIAATLAAQSCTEEVSVLDDQSLMNQKFDASSIVRTFNLSSSSGSGKTTSVGGNNGGGGKYKPVASGADEDGRFDGSNLNPTIVPDGVSSTPFTRGEESVSNQEVTLWSSFVDEANRMNDVSRDEALDHETMHQLTSPVDAKIETEDQAEYFKTELQYQSGLAKDPNSSLLLANYAQFLYLVVQDFDRYTIFFCY